MFIKKNISKHTTAFQQSDESVSIAEQKLNDFIQLMGEVNIDSHKIKDFELKITSAFKQARFKREQIEAFEALDEQPGLSRIELLDNLDVLLSQYQLDSNLTKKHTKKEVSKRIVLILIGVVIMTMGLSMIVMPAPPYFEMFTIFYFNDTDGITLMDLISLFIILVGVYVIIVNISKKNLA